MSNRGTDFFHCLDNNVHIFFCETLEKNRLFDEFFYGFLNLLLFMNDSWFEICLDVELPEGFRTDALATDFLAQFFFLFLLKFFQELLLLLGLILFLVWDDFWFGFIWYKW